jgi:hypothetical protein
LHRTVLKLRNVDVLAQLILCTATTGKHTIDLHATILDAAAAIQTRVHYGNTKLPSIRNPEM